jgi:hypothetical protein
MNEQHADAVAVAMGTMGYTTIPAWMPGVDWLSIQPITVDGVDECEEARGWFPCPGIRATSPFVGGQGIRLEVSCGGRIMRSIKVVNGGSVVLETLPNNFIRVYSRYSGLVRLFNSDGELRSGPAPTAEMARWVLDYINGKWARNGGSSSPVRDYCYPADERRP